MVDRRGFLVLVGVTLGSSGLARGDDDEVTRVLREVSRAREKLKTLVCRFKQERSLALLAATVTSKGELTLVRPDRLRWELFPPDEAIYWVTPEGVAYKTPKGSGKVAPGEAGALGAVLGDVLVILGGDLLKLRERYTIAVERREGVTSLTFSPRDERVAKVLRRARVDLAPDLLSPRLLRLDEPGDDHTTVTFETPKINETVDPARMRPS